jgi:hypothetical protein
MFHNIFFKNRAFYEIMWENMVVPDRRRKDAICMPSNEGKNTDTRS